MSAIAALAVPPSPRRTLGTASTSGGYGLASRAIVKRVHHPRDANHLARWSLCRAADGRCTATKCEVFSLAVGPCEASTFAVVSDTRQRTEFAPMPSALSAGARDRPFKRTTLRLGPFAGRTLFRHNPGRRPPLLRSAYPDIFPCTTIIPSAAAATGPETPAARGARRAEKRAHAGAVGALLALLVILVSGHHTLGGGGAACPASNHSAAVTRVLVLGSREKGCPCFEKPAAWGVQARGARQRDMDSSARRSPSTGTSCCR